MPHLIKLLGNTDQPPKFWCRLSSTLGLTSPQSECIVFPGSSVSPDQPAPITPGGDRCSLPPTRPTASFLPQNEQMPQRGAQSVNVMPLGRMMSYSGRWWLSRRSARGVYMLGPMTNIASLLGWLRVMNCSVNFHSLIPMSCVWQLTVSVVRRIRMWRE